MLALQSHCTAEMLQEQETASGKGVTHMAQPCLFATNATLLHLQMKPSWLKTLLARAGSPRVTISQHWTKQGLQKVSVKGFLAPVQKNTSSTLFHTHLKFGSASLSRSRLSLPPIPSYPPSIQQKYASSFHRAIHSPPKSFPSTVPARGLHNPQI